MPTFPIKYLFYALTLLALVALIAVKSCSSNREEAEQAKQNERSAEALAATANEAAETVVNRAENDATIDELVSETVKEIENAPSDEAAGDAARAAICSLPNYRGDPACQLP